VPHGGGGADGAGQAAAAVPASPAGPGASGQQQAAPGSSAPQQAADPAGSTAVGSESATESSGSGTGGGIAAAAAMLPPLGRSGQSGPPRRRLHPGRRGGARGQRGVPAAGGGPRGADRAAALAPAAGPARRGGQCQLRQPEYQSCGQPEHHHFAVPNESGGAAQAKFAVQYSGYKSGARMLPLMLDIEYDPYTSPTTPASATA
jgi:hypothetical protein